MEEVHTTISSKPVKWREYLGLLKAACLERHCRAGRSLGRAGLYKLFTPFFKQYYRCQARRLASAIDFSNIYVGERRGLVSIILPVYNQADLLEESIESVLNQTYKDLELIVVNDGSTDGVEEILDRYAPQAKVLILTQRNQRLPAALNTGLSHARGEFITWTSADNVMAPNQLAEQVRFLREHDFVQMVYSNYELIDEQGKPLIRPDVTGSATNVVNTDRDIKSLSATYNFINACFLYRSYASRVIGNYDPDAYGAEDYDYWMRMGDFFTIQHMGTNEPLYRYRVHNNTILRREGERIIGGIIRESQKMDIRRRSFFKLPTTCYVPQDMLLNRASKIAFSALPRLKLVRLENCKRLEKLLSNKGITEKTLLVLNEDLMRQKECRAILRHCRNNALLFCFGVFDEDVAASPQDILKVLDWIIVSSKEQYNTMHGIYGNRLLCAPSWREYLYLYAIIGNYHLFYMNMGKKLLCQVPEHSVYK